MAQYGPPLLDWSQLGQIGAAIGKGRKEGAMRDAIQAQIDASPDGKVDFSTLATTALQQGDRESGTAYARLAEAQEQRRYNVGKDERDFEFRRTESQRAQTNADRTYSLDARRTDAAVEGGRVPTGMRRGADGQSLEYIPGGPLDPTVIERTAQARTKPREFSVSDITKLNEEGGKFANISNFTNTFEDRFAGYRNPVVAGVAGAAGRYLPAKTVGKDVAEGSTWWQGYDRFKNVVRNELFGSALTAPEKAAFEKADINAGMDPEQIKKNLKTQQDIARNGLKRKANAMIQSGYKPEAIAAAYGLDLSEIGVTAQPRRGGASTSAGAIPPPPAGYTMMGQ